MSQTLRYPRPRDIAGLGRGHVVVESSAGTGKTFLLEHLFVDLILSRGLACEEILVVTYTEKATAELVLRLRKLVGRLATLRADDVKVRQADDLPASECWVIDEDARKVLGEALLAFDRASIFTIHGFCQRVLRDHAFAQGRFFDEQLVSEETAFSEAFHEVLRAQVARDRGLLAAVEAWLANRRSVSDLEGLLRVCQGQASAPLRGHFDQARLASAMAAWPALAADGDQLRHRLKDAKVRPGTAKAIVGRLARASEIVAACQGDPMRFLSAMQGFPSAARAEDRFAYVLDRLPGASSDASLTALAIAVRELHEATVALELVLAQRLSPLVRERASRRKRQAGLFDFSDMLSLVAEALGDPGLAGRALLEALRRRYRVALIDEFQDTDEVQWSIFRRLFVESQGGHVLTVIGDPKQAIYGFRGADVRAYLGAKQTLLDAGGSRLVLDRNFRSTAAMVAATNLLFEQKAEFFRRESGITYDEPVGCGRADLALHGDSRHAAAPVVVLSLGGDGSPLRAARAQATLQAAIVDELHVLLDPASPLRLHDASGDRPLLAHDVFVLTFTNAESRAIGRALGAASIPFAFYKLGDLFASPEVAEVLDMLRAVADPEDRGLRARALLTRFFDLDLTSAAASLDVGVDAEPARLLLRLATLAESGDIPALFASMIDDSGIACREVFANRGERTLTNITHVLEILQAQWARSHASLPELADLLEAYVRGTQMPPGREGDLQRLETDEDAVQILTVHKAKGLEADVVFVYGGTGESKSGPPVHVLHEDGKRVLHVGRLDDQAKRLAKLEMEDERSRLLYVALTRARYRLYLPHYPPEFKTLRGPYRRANQRFDDLLGPRHERSLAYFNVRPCPDDSSHGEKAARARPPGQTALLSALLASAREPDDVAAIKADRSGFLVTSYTTVKHARAGLAAVDADARVAGELAPARVKSEGGLPGGAETGIFLHDMLATVALADLARAPDFSDWFAMPAVARPLEKMRRRHARPADHLPLAAWLVHRAYTAPVRLGGTVIAGLAKAASALREVEFLFPIPEQAHSLLSRPRTDAPAWKVERGVVKGFVDLLFEHEGKVFVCDWKSDDLPSFDPEALARHCGRNYDVQARIYAIAALRMAGITDPADYARRFGGMVFVFLRGLGSQKDGGDGDGDGDGDGTDGIHFFKPAWKDILAWETDMLGQRFWGIAR